MDGICHCIRQPVRLTMTILSGFSRIIVVPWTCVDYSFLYRPSSNRHDFERDLFFVVSTTCDIVLGYENLSD